MILEINSYISWDKDKKPVAVDDYFETVKTRTEALACLKCGEIEVDGTKTPYRIYGDQNRVRGKDRLLLSIEAPGLHSGEEFGQLHLDMSDQEIVGLMRKVKQKNRETTEAYKILKAAYYEKHK